MSGSGNKLFVGNLAWTTNTGSLQSAFGQFGQVLDAIVMQDRETGRSRGFGFITFSQQCEADAAIEGLNETEIDGRQVRVNYANSQGGRPAQSGGYRAGGGGGGGYGNQSYGGGGGGYGGPGGQQTYGGGGGYTGGHQQNADQWRGSNHTAASGGGGNAW